MSSETEASWVPIISIFVDCAQSANGSKLSSSCQCWSALHHGAFPSCLNQAQPSTSNSSCQRVHHLMDQLMVQNSQHGLGRQVATCGCIAGCKNGESFWPAELAAVRSAHFGGTEELSCPTFHPHLFRLVLALLLRQNCTWNSTQRSHS